MPFLCCSSKADTVMEPSGAPIDREPVKSIPTPRDEIKPTSASSKNSKDSGFDHGDENSSEASSKFITEQSPVEEVKQVVSDDRPDTPDLVLTGQRVSEVPGKFSFLFFCFVFFLKN